jgi:hypothetical protein
LKKSGLPEVRRRKWALALSILRVGMGAALGWCLLERLLGRGYPQSYILGSPGGRFGDFTDQTLSSSDSISLVLLNFFSLVALALLLVQLLRPFIAGAWALVLYAFVFMLLSYPVLFCIDRGNIEILLAALIGWALYFYHQHRDVEGTALLFPAICLKLYPAFLLILLLRRRKFGLAIFCGIAVIAVTLGCCALFQVSLGVIWNSYRQNLDFFRDYYILGNSPIEGAASPWNGYKIVLIGLNKVGLMPPVNFGFDGAFILASYRVYTIALALLALTCGLYAWFYEYKLTRGITMLLLFISIAAPSGGDYRLIYASMALVLLVLEKKVRKGDWTALVLIALAVIPKKEILLTFVGRTETNFKDVPIQTLLNPVFILAAMVVLLWYSRPGFRPVVQRSSM